MEKTEKQKEVEALERNAENNIYCQNDRIVRQYYQVRILPNGFFIDINAIRVRSCEY